jgi:hypothetical protein
MFCEHHFLGGYGARHLDRSNRLLDGYQSGAL